ncbi:hypothetical protein KL86DPRO_20221 [uncultured delta proteobacterium]|uniref:Uncharacterized protein n=1 Tax=uncultured delta proteobacterium TaxID=34034 RepID=A0A212JWW8_9DELT|nr:hypothetical protein KL86DPRO_20221 [uncultured delta proteobacterium]
MIIDEKVLHFSQSLATATALVGKENVLLRIYDRNRLKGGDIVTDFFDLLGHQALIEGAEHNPTLPYECLPFLSTALLPISQTPLRREIVELLRTAYTFPKGSGIGEEYLIEFEEEIDKVDQYLPGYKQLFAERKLSFSLPEVDVKDPQSLFLASLLYKLLIDKRNKDDAELNTGHNAYLLEQAAKLAGREVYFWGCGELYQARKHLFFSAKPKAILVNVPVSEREVDGLAVLDGEEILRSGETLPIVIFSNQAQSVARRIRQLRPDYPAEQIISCTTAW